MRLTINNDRQKLEAEIGLQTFLKNKQTVLFLFFNLGLEKSYLGGMD